MSAAKKKDDKKSVRKEKATSGVKRVAASRAPRPGLGRGLGALINTSTATMTTPTTTLVEDEHQHERDDATLLVEVPTAEILRSPWQPRQNFDEEALNELAESIRANGLIQPLVCRKNSAGRYELIAGERRLRAAVVAGLAKVPVVLVEAENRRAAEMAIIENIQRQDLNAIEEAEGYRTLTDSFNLTQQEVAERVGKARASVANALRLLDLPDEVKQLVSSGLLSPGHAKLLLSLDEFAEQIVLGRKCVTEELTVRALERVIQRRRQSMGDHERQKSGTPDLPESFVRDLTDRLHTHFGTAVRLTPGVTHANGRHSKGMLEIDFYDNDDLDRILTLLGITLD